MFQKNRTTSRTYAYNPTRFFALTYFFTWGFWFLSDYFSHQQGAYITFVILMLLGLAAPSYSALAMILSSKNQNLLMDFEKRLFNLRIIQPSHLPAIFLIMPFAAIVAIGISSFFSPTVNPFRLNFQFSFTLGFLPAPILLILASALEELGWRGYGVDSLNTQFNYFTTTLIFAFLWASWHFPLLFLKNSYYYHVVHHNIGFVINTFVSIIPMAFIINWIYRKNNRSIIAAVLFHAVANFTQEIIPLSQATKCIETGVLFVFAIIIVIKDKVLFFDTPLRME